MLTRGTRGKGSACVAFLLTSVVFIGPVAARDGGVCPGSVPAADDYFDAHVLPGRPGTHEVLVDATKATADFDTMCADGIGRSVWFEVTPLVTGPLIFTTCHPTTSYDTVVQVWRPTEEDLPPFPLPDMCNDDVDLEGCAVACGTGFGSRVEFDAQAGTTYLFQVGQAASASKQGCPACLGVFLTIANSCGDPARNLDCAVALELPGSPGEHEAFVDTSNAFQDQVGPFPSNCDGEFDFVERIVWFRVTPQLSGPMTFTTCDPVTQYDTLVQVYAGDCGAGLEPIACNNDSDEAACDKECGRGSTVTFDAKAGVTYFFQVAEPRFAVVAKGTSCDYCLGVRVKTPPDETPPMLECPESVTVECSGPEGSRAFFEITASDEVDPKPTVVCDPPSGALFSPGITRVVCTATDSSGNPTTCAFNVRVIDTTPPEIKCIEDTTIECTRPEGAVLELDAVAVDLCDPAPMLVCDPPAGTVLSIGEHLVTCIATDASGNDSTCTFTVTVADTTPPVLNCPANATVQCTDPAGVVVEWALPVAVDLCDPAPVVECDPPSGTVFPLGEHTVTCTATDAAGNGATCEFTVTVQDTVNPTVICPDDKRDVECTGLEGAIVDFVLMASDGCDPMPVASAEPPSGTLFPLGCTEVAVAATDASGNDASCAFTVCVLDTTPPVINCPADVDLLCDNAEGVVVEYEATAADLCDPEPVIECDPPSGTVFFVGTHTVVCTATDASGNESTCSFTVDVGSAEVDVEISGAQVSQTGEVVDLSSTVSTLDGLGGDGDTVPVAEKGISEEPGEPEEPEPIYRWEVVSGDCTFVGPTDGETAQVTSDVVGLCVVRLTVDAGGCGPGSDEHTIFFGMDVTPGECELPDDSPFLPREPGEDDIVVLQIQVQFEGDASSIFWDDIVVRSILPRGDPPPEAGDPLALIESVSIYADTGEECGVVEVGIEGDTLLIGDLPPKEIDIDSRISIPGDLPIDTPLIVVVKLLDVEETEPDPREDDDDGGDDGDTGPPAAAWLWLAGALIALLAAWRFRASGPWLVLLAALALLPFTACKSDDDDDGAQTATGAPASLALQCELREITVREEDGTITVEAVVTGPVVRTAE